MKIRTHDKLLLAAILSMWLVNGCAAQDTGTTTGNDSTTSPAAVAAIAAATKSIETANANNWIWRDTEKLLTQARAAASEGDNESAITLANQAKFQADAAVNQYNHETANPRGL